MHPMMLQQLATDRRRELLGRTAPSATRRTSGGRWRSWAAQAASIERRVRNW